MDSGRRNSSVSSVAGLRAGDLRKQTISEACTFVRLVYAGRWTQSRTRNKKITITRGEKSTRRSLFLDRHGFFASLENQQILLNSYATCQRLLDHLKQVAGIQPDGKRASLLFQANDWLTFFYSFRKDRCDGQWRKINRTQWTCRWLRLTVLDGSKHVLHSQSRR